MKETNFFTDKVGVRSLHDRPGEMMAAVYLKASFVSQAMIFVTRSRSWSYIGRPGLLLVSAFIIAQALGWMCYHEMPNSTSRNQINRRGPSILAEEFSLQRKCKEEPLGSSCITHITGICYNLIPSLNFLCNKNFWLGIAYDVCHCRSPNFAILANVMYFRLSHLMAIVRD